MKTLNNRSNAALISVVLPVLNESKILCELVRRISSVLVECRHPFEIIFVNDGSTDQTPAVLDELAGQKSFVKVLHLTRNFGQQAAVQAGIQHASGEAVILMDSDLQDDPKALAGFIEQWKNGYDVVYAVREKRKEGIFKRLMYYSFYRVLGSISKTQIPKDAGIFSLLDREVVDKISRMPEMDRYFPGLRSWVGFKQNGLVVERLARYDEVPRLSWSSLFGLAKTALISFSTVPLSAFYVVSALTLLLCAGSLIACGASALMTGSAPATGLIVLAISAGFAFFNSLGIAILGEYVLRIYDQVRARPLYLVARSINFQRHQASLDEAELYDLLSQDWTQSLRVADVEAIQASPVV